MDSDRQKTILMDSATDRQPSPVIRTANGAAALIERRWLLFLLAGMGAWTLTPWLAPLFMHWGWTGAGRAIYTIYSAFCHQMPQRSWFFFGPKLSYSLAEITAVWPEPTTIFGLRGFIGTPEMGWKLAWSDRMVSFYGGFFLFGLLYLALRGLIRRRNWHLNWRWLLLLILPIALDGVTHMISDLAGIGVGFRETNAWLAVLTGNAFPAEFYAGDAWGSFNSIMRLVTGLLASFGFMFWALPIIDGAYQPKRRQVSKLTAAEGVVGHNN